MMTEGGSAALPPRETANNPRGKSGRKRTQHTTAKQAEKQQNTASSHAKTKKRRTSDPPSPGSSSSCSSSSSSSSSSSGITLPDEVLCEILAMLPKESVAPAARTCRQWFACSPSHLRQRFFLSWACSSLAALQWSRVHANEGMPWDHRVCGFAAKKGLLEVLQ